MRIGCCTDMTHYNTLVDRGYDSIVLSAYSITLWDEAAFEANLRILENGTLERISLNDFCAPSLRLNGSGWSPKAIMAYMRKLAPRAKRLGFRYIGVGAPESRKLDIGDDPAKAREEFKQSLRIACDIAAKHRMDVLLESICGLKCNFINTTREALSLVRELSLPNLHLIYDIYHELTEGQPMDVIREAADEIRIVHISNNDGGKRAYLNADSYPLCLAYWKELKAIGYDGEWSIEASEGDADDGIAQSIEIMKRVRGR